jgi:hypothetical protein
MENSDPQVCCETGSGMHFGSGSGLGSGSNIKYNENQIIKNERPNYWKINNTALTLKRLLYKF